MEIKTSVFSGHRDPVEAERIQALLHKRRHECAYTEPCRRCIHQACLSYRDQAAIDAAGGPDPKE